jgi:hypothetical protein
MSYPCRTVIHPIPHPQKVVRIKQNTIRTVEWVGSTL